MESIAQRAEIATGTLYNYYKSKPSLLIAICADLLDENADIEQLPMLLYGSLMILHQTYITIEDMTEEQLSALFHHN